MPSIVAVQVSICLGVVVAGQSTDTAVSSAPTPSAAIGLFQLPSVEDPRSLTLDTAEQMAVMQNPSLAHAVAAVAIANGHWVQAGLLPDPTVSVGQAQTGSRGLAEQDYAGVTQTIVTGGKLRLNRAVAGTIVARAQQNLEAQRNRVLTDVRTAFFDLLIAQAQRETAIRLTEIARESVRIVEKAEAGDVTTRNDILESQIELATAEITLRNSDNRVRAATIDLITVMGEPHWRFDRVAGQFDALPPERNWEQTLNRLLCSSPELAASFATQEHARASLERARAARVPDVTVQGLVNWRDNGIGGRSDGAVQVSLPLPLWDRNRGNIASAEAEVIASSRGLETRRLELEKRLGAVFERYSNARQQVVVYRDRILPAARETLMLTVKNYEAGEVDYDDVITSQRTNATATINYLDAVRELWRAEFEIEGMLLTDSLALAGP